MFHLETTDFRSVDYHERQIITIFLLDSSAQDLILQVQCLSSNQILIGITDCIDIIYHHACELYERMLSVLLNGIHCNENARSVHISSVLGCTMANLKI